MKRGGKLGQILPVRPLLVNDLLKKLQDCVCYPDEIFLADYSLVGPFQFGTKGIKKLKYPKNIHEKQWKELDK